MNSYICIFCKLFNTKFKLFRSIHKKLISNANYKHLNDTYDKAGDK